MKLLFITRKIDKDDGLAGFTFNWLKHFAQAVDELHVICQEKGNAEGLPDNVKICSLGKEKNIGKWGQLKAFIACCRAIVPGVDGVFAHQNPEYGIIAAPFALWHDKKLIAWYTHKQISWKLRLLNMLASKMVTASAESFRLPSSKLRVLHHGIDTEHFAYKPKSAHDELRLLSISRISPTKNLDLMIDLVEGLNQQLDQKIIFRIAGEPALTADKNYLLNLKKEVSLRGLDGSIEFIGSIPNSETPALYHWADAFVNFSNTGSLDKAVLEAMSCGTPVITSNQAFQKILLDVAPKYYLSDFTNMTERVMEILENDDENVHQKLSEYVRSNHDLTLLVNQIVNLFRR